jgi:hypothetical protein
VNREDLALEAACCAFLRAKGQDPQAARFVLGRGRFEPPAPAWQTIVSPMRAAIRVFLESRCSYEPEDEIAWAISGWLVEITPDKECGNVR